MISDLRRVRHGITPIAPPAWAQTGHLQTILGHLLPSPSLTEAGEEVQVTLESETERIHSTYLRGDAPVVVYLFHGLAGTSDATYMHRTALVARSLGYHVFLNNHRGCGRGVGLATEPYHSGRAEDLSKVIAYGRSRFPTHRHIAVGFSLSANALLLLAAGVRAEVLPDMAIAVNAPINLDVASLNLTKGLNRIYNFRFMLELRNHVKKNHPVTLKLIEDVWELRHFDAAYTAPVGGFKDRADYYATCSAKQYLKDIRIPTVLLTAKDDPFVDYWDYLSATLSDQVILHVEDHGGHMGYLTTGENRRWLDYAVKEYLKRLGTLR